jgi:hypothetical protein
MKQACAQCGTTRFGLVRPRKPVFLCERALRPAYVNGQVLPFGPAALLERFAKGAKHRRERRHRPDHGYAPNPIGLLRTRRERPRSHAADERDEIAPFHCQCLQCCTKG